MLTAIERILILAPWLVGNLNAGAQLIDIFEQVDVRPLIESVMRRLVLGWSVKVMDVSEA